MNLKSQIQNKQNGEIRKLLITLNKIIRNEGNDFVVIMSNSLKTISALGAPLYVIGRFFLKKASHVRISFLGKKIRGKLF